MSGTGIRQISHRFMSQFLYYCFCDYRFLRFSIFFFLSLSTILLHCFAIKGSMFNGDCLSLSNDNGNAFLSRYVMLCHVPDTTLPLFDTSVTVANMNFPRGDYNKCGYTQNVSIKRLNYNSLFVINQTPHHLLYFEFPPAQRLRRL